VSLHTRPAPVRTDSRGMTLIEMMIAASVITVGILGMISLFQVCQIQSERAQSERLATTAASAVFDNLDGLGFVQMVNLDGNVYFSDESGTLPSIADLGASLKGLPEGQVTLQERDAQPVAAVSIVASNLVEVSVIVQWTDRNITQERTYTRLYGR